jgi:hypothetical protein
VLDQQDRGAVAAQLTDQLGELLPLHGAQPRCGLVEEEHPRQPRERAGDLEPALLAEREPLGRARRPVEEPHPAQAVLGLGPDRSLLPPL